MGYIHYNRLKVDKNESTLIEGNDFKDEVPKLL
jgi:hypothetical protein